MTNRNQLIEDGMKNAKIKAHIYHRRCRAIEFDDAYQDAMIGLIEAADNFDSSHGVEFNTYANYLILGRMRDGIRGMDELQRNVRRDVNNGSLSITFRNVDKLAVNETPRIGADQVGAVLDAERCELVASLLDGLPKRLRLILSLYYYDELSMKEIALVLDVNESRISQLHTKAIKMLRCRLIKNPTQQTSTVNGSNPLIQESMGSAGRSLHASNWWPPTEWRSANATLGELGNDKHVCYESDSHCFAHQWFP